MDPTTIEEKVARLESLAPAEPVIPVEWVDDEDPNVSSALAWRPQNDRDLDWCLARIAELTAQVESIEAQAAATIERVEKRKAELIGKVQRGIGFFTFHAVSYGEAHKRELLTGKKKSRDFIHGRLAWRKRGGKLRVEDKAALVAWLETQPPESGLYRIKVEPEMAALQAAFKADGVIPPGCTFEPEEDVLHVESISEGMVRT